ncbi:MAG: PAS domain S-box protein [Prolixibacteraceae bacterium]
MEKSYRILLLEDNPYDAELNMRQIRKFLSNPLFQVVCQRDEYINMLDTFFPDIILSDYNLPTLDGLSALRIAQEKCPLTPFIIITGSINEDTAVDCMKAGATDYILKDSLKRLGSAIISAIEQRDLRKQRFESDRKIKEIGQSYLGLFNSVSEAIYILNKEQNFVAINESALKMYGYTSDEIIGTSPAFLSAPELNDHLNLSEIIQNVYDTGKIVQFEFWGKKKNGEIFPKEVICKKGKYFGEDVLIATARDITERKVAEEKLNRERKLLRTVIDNLPVTIYVKDSECRKIIANRADFEILGANSEEEVLGKTDLEVFNSEIGERGYLDDKTVIDSGMAVLNRQEDFYDKHGCQHWLSTSKIPLLDENGKTTGLVGIGMDITKQKQDQEEIQKLSQGIEQSPAVVIITDTEGKIEYVNPRFTESTGYTREEAIGNSPQMLKSGLIPDEVYKELWETISSGKVWNGELLNKMKDGTFYWEAATITGIINEKGTITNYIGVMENITDRKKMQSELIEAKEKAEESDRLKSAFLANMSHEIRTPLNSIIGFSELLADPDFDEEQKSEFIRAIINNGNSLLVIISDIMDFSMLEAKQIKIRTEKISSNRLLADLKKDFNPMIEEKGLNLQIHHPEIASDITIETDLYRLKQIFTNLIGNAIKFTEKGYIEIGYELKSSFIEFHVKDTGIGIAPEYHQAIFDRFRQIDTAKTRKYGGNGLGLAITKNLVKLLGGDIWIESEKDKYSIFYFTIPINKME